MHLVAVGIAFVVLFVGAAVGKKDSAKFLLKHPETQVHLQEVLSTEDQTLIETPIPTAPITPSSTSVYVYEKNGQKYALVNGIEFQLDANGCYTYSKNGTQIQACVTN